MLKRIWQWLKELFQRLFGGATRLPERGGQDTHVTIQDAPTAPPLADSDYEYLFRQLLKGVAHGWDRERVVRWFESLKGRVTPVEWVAWLHRFGEGVLASPTPNNELAVRLVQLGDMTLSTPSLQEIGEVAYDIGRQLLSRESSGVIWEYEGPDAPPLAPRYQDGETMSPLTPVAQEGEQTQQETAPVETITLDELFLRMQQDANLAQMVAQQLGLETSDPQMIIQELIDQFNAANPSAPDEAEA